MTVNTRHFLEVLGARLMVPDWERALEAAWNPPRILAESYQNHQLVKEIVGGLC